MCVKCGINACGGCSGKTTKYLTGEVFYDGAALACLGSYDINPGDSLNSVIESVVPVICSNKSWIDPIDFNYHYDNIIYGGTMPAADPVFDVSLMRHNFTAEEEGLYEVFADIDYQLIGTGVEANIGTYFYIGEATPVRNEASGASSISFVTPSANASMGGRTTIRYTYTKTAGNSSYLDIACNGQVAGLTGSIVIGRVVMRIMKIG